MASSNVLPDPQTPFGQRVRSRLRDDVVAWMTTVGDDGTPQPNPIWFLWDGTSFVVYNRRDAQRLRHIETRPNVALNLDGDRNGGDIIVISGRAELAPDEPPPHEVPEYVNKYGQRMTAIAGSPAGFSEAFPVPVRVHLRKVRGF